MGKKKVYEVKTRSMNTILFSKKTLEICLEGITRNCQHSLPPRSGTGGQGMEETFYSYALLYVLILNCANLLVIHM